MSIWLRFATTVRDTAWDCIRASRGYANRPDCWTSFRPGPLVVRWNLHPSYGYEEAREHYYPFTRLVDEDLPTRVALARLCLQTVSGGHTALVIANNKAEGSAPLSVFKLAELIADELSRSKPER